MNKSVKCLARAFKTNKFPNGKVTKELYEQSGRQAGEHRHYQVRAVGGDFDDLEIKTRGMTDAYFDLQAAKLNKAARSLGGDVNRIPGRVRRQITVDWQLDY